LQLGPLFVFGKKIAFHGGGKAALRAERQIFQRYVDGGLLYAANQYVTFFQLRTLGTDKPQNYRLALGNKPQRSKRAGAFVVISQQGVVGIDAAEEFFAMARPASGLNAHNEFYERRH